VNGSWQSGAKRGVNINFNIYGHGFIYGYEAKMIEPARSFRHVISYDDLSPNKFEALVFRYLEMSDEFDRPEWLQSTNAGDSGRDISAVERRTKNRVAVQAKHWLKSINQNEIHSCIPSLMTWNPPFDKLLFVASGTFTQNAIRYSENNNDINNSIEIELWSGEMFKARLANYPALLPHG
jgi:predicted helicase